MTTATATAVATRTYQIDKAHSEAAFQVRHLLGKVRGRFADFDGVIDFDPDAPEAGSVQFTIQAASINTNEPSRDAHLRSGDFFAADEHPTLTFVSREVRSRNLGAAKDPWGHDKVAFEAETTLNRTDFGLLWNAALETGGLLVGDDVRVFLMMQAIAK